MEFARFCIISILVGVSFFKHIDSSNDVSQRSDQQSNLLADLILDTNEKKNQSINEATDTSLSRVKRQFYYEPYLYRRRRPYYNTYPVPIPILVGGGFGVGPRFGGRGFGARGLGGFGGRGIGGGFGGRGGGRG